MHVYVCTLTHMHTQAYKHKLTSRQKNLDHRAMITRDIEHVLVCTHAHTDANSRQFAVKINDKKLLCSTVMRDIKKDIHTMTHTLLCLHAAWCILCPMQLGRGANAKAARKTPESQLINYQMNQNSCMHATKGTVTPSKRHADADDDGFGGPDSSLSFIFEVTRWGFDADNRYQRFDEVKFKYIYLSPVLPRKTQF